MLKYTILQSFGEKGTGEGQFKSPSCIALNSKNEIFIADEFNHRVQKFDKHGSFLFCFGSFGKDPAYFYYPTSIACDKEDNIFVTDRWNHRIQMFSPQGKFLKTFGLYEKNEGNFNEPFGIAITRQDEIIVADSGNHRLQHFSHKGTFLNSFAHGGPNKNFYQGPDFKSNFIFNKWITQQNKFNTVETIFHNNHYKIGVLEYPKSIFIDDKNTLWVCDNGNDRIINFSIDGKILNIFGEFESNKYILTKPISVCKTDNFLFVATSLANNIHKINLSSKEENIIKIEDTIISSICLNDDNTLWICDTKNDKIFRIKISNE